MYIDLAEFWQGQYPHIPVYAEQSMLAWRNSVENYEPTAFLEQPLINQWNNAYLSEG